MKAIEIYYTICTDYDYALEIFAQQMKRLEVSGLSSEMRKMTITVAGSKALDIQALPFASKIEILNSLVPSEGEFTTLSNLHYRSQKEDFYAFYFHSKGCTHGSSNKKITDWREMLEYFLVDEWRQAVKLLEGNDTVGCNQASKPSPHYSGNFWWAKSSYIRHLPSTNDKFLGFYSLTQVDNFSEQHARLRERTGFDSEFVRLTYPESSKLEILPNLRSFIAQYGFDWIWFVRRYCERELSAEEAIERWKHNPPPDYQDYQQFFDHYRRINVEFWILRNEGEHHCLYRSNVHHYEEEFPVERYYGSARKRVAVLVHGADWQLHQYRNSPDTEYHIYVCFPHTEASNPGVSLSLQVHAVYSYYAHLGQVVALLEYLRRDSRYEKVLVSRIDWERYKHENVDLAQFDLPFLIGHYISYGRDEGRLLHFLDTHNLES